ncbi:redox-regulated ATPase YchF [Chloroflexota bacterium]
MMSVDIGIIGLARSGKTTILNSLTGVKRETGSSTSHIGITKIPDPRLNVLDDMLHPKKVVPTEARFIDMGASAKGLVDGKGIGGEFLLQLSNVDALMAVVRAFSDETIPHVEGSLDTERDIATINLELTFSDLSIIERRLEKIDTSLKGAKLPEREHLYREQEILLRIKAGLDKDMPIRELTLSPDDARVVASYQFLTARPLLIVVNVGEEQLPGATLLEGQLNEKCSQPGCRVITLCGKLEMELAQLDKTTAEEFRTEYDLKESGRDRAIRLSYELLGLLSFFSIASDEIKAWPIQNGTNALKAAGKIHSDMERGFIRAEVISYDDLVRCGSIAEARRKGLLRLEGKNYVVRDGDVITFLFNV